jgi:two-component system C4-dicarboxylate transport response regulator DctD
MNDPRSILIVDDDLLVAGFVLAVLGNNYDCKTATNVGDALLLLQSHPFNLAIVDVGLPDCSGLAFNLYVQNARPGTPVVLISGDCDPSGIEQAKENGVYEFLQKPFSPAQLLSVVEQAIKHGSEHMA